MNILITNIFIVIISFLFGSIMYSYILPKLINNVDISEISDDKNPGAGNVAKNGKLTKEYT